MSTFQVTTVSLSVLGNLITGFAILVLPFTSPAIAADWQLPPDVLGAMLSAVVLGMMIGALLIAPFADKIGRRPTLLLSMVFITVGLLLSSIADGPTTMMIARVVTGIGAGSTAASFNTLVAEYSSDKWRDLGIGLLVSIGAVAGVVGGLVTAYFVANYDWRATYIFGTALSGVVTVCLAIWLPESVDFLFARRPANTLDRINTLLTKMRIPALDALPDVAVSTTQEKPGFRSLFSEKERLKTTLACIAVLSTLSGFYFITSWTPKLLVDAGWTVQQSITANIMLSVGGIFSGLGFGFASRRLGYRTAINTTLIAITAFFILFGMFGANIDLLFILPPILGFFLFGSIIAQFAVLPRIFAPAIRNTGTGLSMGLARLGAFTTPYLAGVMLAAGWDGMNLYYLFCLTCVVALAAVIGIWKVMDRQEAKSPAA